MPRPRYATLTVCLLASLMQQATASEPFIPHINKSMCVKIPTGPGPHSLLTRSNPSKMLISSHDRRHFERQGNIYEYKIDSGKMNVLPRTGEPSQLEFRPHHMAVQEVGSTEFLYVINHDDKSPNSNNHSILVYTAGNGKLTFREQLKDPLLSSPNHLAVMPNGEIYVSNDRRNGGSHLELLLRQKKATIVHYKPGAGWRIVAEGLTFPNGIQATTSQVFVSTTFGNSILAYPREPDGTLGAAKTVLSQPLLDGLNSTKKAGYYTVVSHGSLLDFMRHQRNGRHASPASVYEVNVASGKSRIIFKDNGELISGISAAVYSGDSIFFGQSFEPFLLRCPYM